MPNFPNALTVTNTADAATVAGLAAMNAGLSEVMPEFPLASTVASILTRVSGWKLFANRFTRRGASNRTPLEIFNSFSTAYTAPAGVFHVDVAAGSNTNNGLTQGTAFKSIYKAQQSLAALGSAGGIIHVYNTGHYNRADNFYGSSAAAQCTVPTLFIAHGGVIDTSTAESITWTADATFTNTYTSSITAADWSGVYDMAAYNSRNRGYGELQLVGSAAICNRTPGSYFITGTTLYVNRADGAAPTNVNTRACRGVFNFRVNSALPSVAFIGAEPGDGWGFLGGPNNAGSFAYLPLQALPKPAQLMCVVADNVRTQGGFHGFSVNSTYGLVYLKDCGGTGAQEDIFNLHNNKGDINDIVAINPWGRNAGKPGHLSNQIWTQHDNANCRAIVIGADFDDAAGGLVRNIGGSKLQIVYPTLGSDRGDKIYGGVVEPVAIRADDANTEIHILDADIVQGNVYDVLAYSGSAIYNQGRPLRMTAQSGGTVGTWSA